jgi:hypothetical protein
MLRRTVSDLTVIFAAAIAAVPPTLLGVATLWQAITNAASARVTDGKTDAIIRRTDEIHTLTNSNLAEVTKTLQVANEKISGLEKLLGALTVRTLPVDVHPAVALELAQQRIAELERIVAAHEAAKG